MLAIWLLFAINAFVSVIAVLWTFLGGLGVMLVFGAVFLLTNAICLFFAIRFASTKAATWVAFSLAPVPAAILLITAAVVALDAFKRSHPIERNWEEVVKISSGEEIVAKRWEREQFSDRGLWLFDEARIEANLPGAGQLTWQTSLSPWLLDKASDGTWYLVGMARDAKGRREYSIFAPNDGYHPTFAAYKLAGGVWQRVISDFPPELRSPNLLVYSYRVFDPPKPQEPISNGSLIDLVRKTEVNLPGDRLQEVFFSISADVFAMKAAPDELSARRPKQY